MISVLIPVYNYDAITLTDTLVRQFSLADIDFEIICVDDASTKSFSENDKLKKNDKVSFYKLSKNIGRSKIRNLLAEKAQYDWLLFLDVDVIPKHENFIDTYLDCIKSKKATVCCGGIAYQKKRPENNKLLRWQYGKKRETVSVSVREKYPYRYFFGANFLINKSVFKMCKFDETILKYGYEDVLFVQKLKKNHIKIAHIDNDVYHLGIEKTAIFLDKTKQAIANLHYLNTRKDITDKELSVLKWYKRLEAYKLKKLFALFYILFTKMFEKNLKSKVPFLFIFDIYKLTYFCFISKENPDK